MEIPLKYLKIVNLAHHLVREGAEAGQEVGVEVEEEEEEVKV